MAAQFRIIDSGVRDGRSQIAFDQALIELHGEGRSPDTLRFLRFPPTVLIGRHQAISSEVRLENCRRDGVGLVRRITGGGAIYLDEGQVGWELIFARKSLPMSDLGIYTSRICAAVAAGLSAHFAIDASFRPRNDIEVAGRKLCGTGGFFDGGTLIYQGTVLVDVDPAAMMSYLNVPQAKLAKRALDRAEQRIVTLKDLLGEAPSVAEVHRAIVSGISGELAISALPGEITGEEEGRAAELLQDEIGTDEFVFGIDDPGGADILEASRSCPGGTINAYLRLEGKAHSRRVREVLLTGDFFVSPPRMILDLEAAMRGVALDRIAVKVDAFFSAAAIDTLSLTPADFACVILAAAQRSRA